MKKLSLTLMLLTLSVAMIFAASVSGTVTDAETGEGIANANVRFHVVNPASNGNGPGHGGGNGHQGGNSGGGNGGGGNNGECDDCGDCENINVTVFTAVSDSDGYYFIDSLPEGEYIARASVYQTYQNLTIRNLNIAEGENYVDFELVPHQSLGRRIIELVLPRR